MNTLKNNILKLQGFSTNYASCKVPSFGKLNIHIKHYKYLCGIYLTKIPHKPHVLSERFNVTSLCLITQTFVLHTKFNIERRQSYIFAKKIKCEKSHSKSNIYCAEGRSMTYRCTYS